eukprot:gene18615-20492_t
MGKQISRENNEDNSQRYEKKNASLTTKDEQQDDGEFVLEEEEQISVLIVGAGMRGQIYARYARDFPGRMKVVGVAEPVLHRRTAMQKWYNIDENCVFSDWKQAVEIEKFADAVVIATLDDQHKDPCIAFANKGYHILLEKPMATTLQDCEDIVTACKQNKIILAVGHVLRYTPHYLQVKEIIDSGRIGDVVHIQHMEPVGWYHFAHSYVRGNWRKTSETAFSLLTKSCHDIDLLQSFMGKAKCTAVSSFGSLTHFKKSNKPQGATSRCLDCPVEKSCPYSAVKHYLEPVRMGMQTYFCQVVSESPVPEEMEKELRSGPYGRCVYECDNDVVSNQVVNMSFEGGKTASFSMVAFTEKVCERQTTIFGTRGEMSCNEGYPIRVFDFVEEIPEVVQKTQQPEKGTSMSGHGFADYFLMRSFVKAVAKNDPSLLLSGADETLESHRLVFLAEQARIENSVINISHPS